MEVELEMEMEMVVNVRLTTCICDERASARGTPSLDCTSWHLVSQRSSRKKSVVIQCWTQNGVFEGMQVEYTLYYYQLYNIISMLNPPGQLIFTFITNYAG